MTVAFGLALLGSQNLAWELAELPGLDGGTTGVNTYSEWVDNYGQAMRTNLGDIIYFNTPEN